VRCGQREHPTEVVRRAGRAKRVFPALYELGSDAGKPCPAASAEYRGRIRTWQMTQHPGKVVVSPRSPNDQIDSDLRPADALQNNRNIMITVV